MAIKSLTLIFVVAFIAGASSAPMLEEGADMLRKLANGILHIGFDYNQPLGCNTCGEDGTQSPPLTFPTTTTRPTTTYVPWTNYWTTPRQTTSYPWTTYYPFYTSYPSYSTSYPSYSTSYPSYSTWNYPSYTSYPSAG